MDNNYFKNLDDNDFYSDKLTHLYLEGEIFADKIDKLIDDIKTANLEKKPKPVLIHINSTGGKIEDGMRLLSVYKLSKVPIATIIDSYCFSIATLLAINSPYRIMTKYSFCLLHEYRLTGSINSEKKDIMHMINKLDNYFKSIIDMYLNKTSFKKEELYKLIKHNLILDCNICLKKNIVDRIIDCNFINKAHDINIYKLINDTKINNLYISCNILNEDIDKKIREFNLNKPCLIYSNYTNCSDNNEKKQENTKFKKEIANNILENFNLITRIKSIPIKKYAIIDIPISLENLLPLLFADKIYMYSHSFIICNVIDTFINYSLLLDDNIKNSKMIMNIIKGILKEKTKMINVDIDKKFIILNATKAKKLGICHEIINA